MAIRTADLLDAFAAIAPPLYLSALSRQLGPLDRMAASAEVGAAIVSALCPDTRFGDLGAKELVGVEVYHADGGGAWLCPDQVAISAGLSDWVPHTLAEAAMVPVEATRTLADAVSDVPIVDAVGVVIAEGVCSGQLSLTFPTTGARVIAYYGQRVLGTLFATTSYGLAGASLCAVGDHLRLAVNAHTEMVIAGEAQERAALQRATVH